MSGVTPSASAIGRATAIKIVVSVVVVAGAVGFLLTKSMKEGAEYYKHVDEVMSQPEAWYGKNMQLHGYVVDPIRQRRNTMDYEFSVQNNGAVVQATYTGIVPDTFKGGSEVVLKGRLAADGFHVAPDGVMAKCPSKYDAAKIGTK